MLLRLGVHSPNHFLINKDMTINKLKIKFAPGCFDDFEGTQEELDSMVKEIYQLAESGELFSEMSEMSEDELSEYLDGAEINIRNIQPPTRTLQ